jgi:hypothetical protein
MNRKKINFIDFYRLNINYYKTAAYYDKKENMRFMCYFLADPLTEAQTAELKQFKNIKILKSCTEYAPELKTTVLAVYEKILKADN